MQGRQKDERGASAVEFALVLPVLVMILFGTITSGLSYANALGVTNAVREGARFAATADATQATWGADVIDRVRDSQLAHDPTVTSAVCVQLWKIGTGAVKSECSPGASPTPSAAYPPPPSGVAGTCVVQVVAARPYEVNIIFHSWNNHIIRGSVARYERADTC